MHFFLILLLSLHPCIISNKGVMQRKLRDICFLALWCGHWLTDFLADILTDIILSSGPGKEEEKRGKSDCNDPVWHAWALTSFGVYMTPGTIIVPQELVRQYHIFTSTAACHTNTALCCYHFPLLADRSTCCCVFTLCHYATLCIFNWAHFMGASHVFSKAYLLLSALEIASDLGPNSPERMSISIPVFFPRDSSRVTRSSLRCEWVWRADFSCLISSAPGRFLIENMPWSYFWLVCKQLLICG